MSFKNILRGIKALFLSVFGFNKKTRYEAKHQLLTGLGDIMGFRVHNKYTMWANDKEYLALWNAFKSKDSNKVHERRFNMYYLAKSTKGLQGDTAECGVWFGAGSYMIMNAVKGDGKTHHIFDSFEGLSQPDSRDNVASEIQGWQKGDLSVGEQIVEKNLKGCGDYKLYKGWIPERFKDVEDKKFSFVHIDVDLYQPTYDSLAFFYDRLVPGGIMLCDDYGSTRCPGAYDALNEFFKNKPEEVAHLTGGQGFVVKR